MFANNEITLFGIKEEWADRYIPDEHSKEHRTEMPPTRYKEEPVDKKLDDEDFGLEPGSSEVTVKTESISQNTFNPFEPISTTTVPCEAPSSTQSPINSRKQSVDLDLETELSTQAEAPEGIEKAERHIYSCDNCDYLTNHLGNWKRHLRQHLGKIKKAPRDKVYACELCLIYKCSDFGRLKKHLMTHTREKPLACGLCEFRSLHSNDLQRHMMIHTGEKPFACDVCNYKSSDIRNLKRHKRTHTGEKPYACDSCQYKSRISHHMKRHKMMKHPTTP